MMTCHIRLGPHSVRPEIYMTIHQLMSEYHMSKRQALGSVCTVANNIFGRKEYGEWKTFTDGVPTDQNTLPAPQNINRTETYVEALVLSGIAHDIMSSDSETVVTYSNDGSSQSGVGGYIVQSFSIDGKQRALPTLNIFSESRATLKELELMTFQMLAAATGYKYSEKDLVEKIDFIITDSTAHNLGVIKDVCEDLNIDSVPGSLVCHIHPMMMFQRVVKSLFQEIHDALGTNAIKDCFITEIDFKHESFIYKAINCLCSFINGDYSSKPWNRQQHFDSFISPKKNESLSLKDHRFDRLFECCLRTLYHLDDIKQYLDTHKSILNDIAILDRSFLDMELLKPIFCSVALIGIHFTKPYLVLLLDKNTTYERLIQAFPILYSDLKNANVDNIMQTDIKIVEFVNKKEFERTLPKECLRESVNGCVSEYKKEIKQFLTILLPRMAAGLSEQRGALFGFGPKANEDTGSLLKISQIEDEDIKKKLNKAMIHNLNEERSVGFINYEICIRGKQNLEAASRKMVINKSIDIALKAEPSEISKFRKQAKAIKEVKTEWRKKVKEHQENKYSEKERIRLKDESIKYDLLSLLKKETLSGPFTSPEEIENYINNSDEEENLKNIRMYNEVKYARMTSTSLKPTNAVFRLKKNYKNLPTEEYVDNLSAYLSNARSCKTLTIQDLSNVIHCIAAKTSSNIENGGNCHILEKTQTANTKSSDVSEQGTKSKSQLQTGEHIIAFWIEGNDIKWYLGIVDEVKADGSGVVVSYMTRTDNAGRSWVFPEKADINNTLFDQIIATKVQVNYSGSIRIKCQIECLNLIEEMNTMIKAHK